MTRTSHGRRARWIAALSVFLTLAGGGAAVAHWSAASSLDAQAKAARVGIAQTVHPASATGSGTGPTPLATTYSAQSTRAAGAVSVTNTGTRRADYTVSLTASSATDARFPGAVSVVMGVVGRAADCTPATSLGGTPSTLSAAPSATGRIDAGATVVVCVQTWITEGDATTYAKQSARLALASRLVYAAGEAWKTQADAVTFTQAVAEAPAGELFFTDSSGRYQIQNQGICIIRYPSAHTHLLARDARCGGYAEQWRMYRNADGTFFIGWAQNTSSSPIAPRWTALTRDQTLETRSAETAAQRWNIRLISGNQYRIESVSSPGQCATVGGGLWNPTDTTPRRLVLAACSDAATQRFTFHLQGVPLMPLQDAACTRVGEYLEFGFEPNPDYQQEISYRALLSREATPDTKSVLATGPGEGLGDGWNTYVRLRDAGSNLSSYVGASGGGTGNTWVWVEQRIAGSPWSTTARAKFHIARSGGQLVLSCGWR